MADASKVESAPAAVEEDRLAHALISRGLITREEFQQIRGDGTTTLESFLKALVKAGFLTPSQARRAMQELPPLLNQPVPGYQLLDKLGQGSMGTVFKAKQLSMNRLVAIKILNPKLAANPEFLQRFNREAHLAAKFSSNNVVQAIDVGSAGSLHYFVMEYVEGVTIKQELEKGKVYEEHEGVEIVLQIAQALQHAHRRQLIHRDIKPANIVLTSEGIAKLADLGMARGTGDAALAKAEKGLTIGTPYYIAPEQVHSREDVDSRADIYSLGATFYHMVTGQPPFPHKKVEDVLRAHLEEELTPPDHLNQKLSAGLGEVVEFMMAKHRRQRYQMPADLITDLECLLNGEPPKLARQRLEAASLKALAEGEVDEDDQPDARQEGVPLLWVGILAGVLALSILVNLILIARG
jgi:eukaryotic-like serine/threonine-protein kinase